MHSFVLFAAKAAKEPPVPESLIYIGLITIAVVMILLSTLMVASRFIKRCPSNRVLVKWGTGTRGRSATTIHGGTTIVLPILQDFAFLSLDPIQIEVPLKGALSAENIRVNVPSVFTVAIGTSDESMQRAAERLLGLTRDEISQQASDLIFGQLRQVIASMEIEEINRDRDKFLQSIQESLEPELRKIGLVLLNVNITDITDDSGYIEAIGRKAASAAIQQAEIDVAEQIKHGATGVAKAEQERSIAVANATRDQEIGVKQADQQRSIRVAELEREQKVGVETARFQQEASIKAAERDMRIQLAQADAQAIGGENESKAEVAKSQATLAIRQAEAYQASESKKREAEAQVLETQYTAQAKAAAAEALKVEAEQRAALEAPAKAAKARLLVEAEAAAEQKRLLAEGEAKAIYAKLEAEARGQYEIMSKKAEGLREIVTACGGSQAAFQLLMLEHMDELSKTAAQAISNIKFDKVIVWEGGGSNGTTATASFLQNMAKSLPPMLNIMQDIGGVKMPAYFAQFEDGIGQAPPSTIAEGTNGTNGSTAGSTSAGKEDKPAPTAPTVATAGKPSRGKSAQTPSAENPADGSTGPTAG